MQGTGKPADRLGSIVAGKYELLRLLGIGGMSVVYEARHTYTGKHVAVKLLTGDRLDPGKHAQRFLREARAASAIGHPAIVDVLDAGEAADGMPYLVLELLEGEDLGAAIREAPLDAQRLGSIALDVLDGLGAAHACGIVHRDIKPENIFLVDSGEVEHAKILDFGVAKLTRVGPLDVAVTIEGAVLGTPYYMSPEQARGDAVDPRSDLWSLGAVMFRALTGRPPFDERNYNRLIYRILSERAKKLHGQLPDWIADVVDRALEPDRELRWQTAEDMAGALRPHVPTRVEPTARVSRSGTRARAQAAVVVDEGAATLGDVGRTVIDPTPPAGFESQVMVEAPAVATAPAAAAPMATPARTSKGPWIAVGVGVVALVVVGVIGLGKVLGGGEQPTTTTTTTTTVAARTGAGTETDTATETAAAAATDTDTDTATATATDTDTATATDTATDTATAAATDTDTVAASVTDTEAVAPVKRKRGRAVREAGGQAPAEAQPAGRRGLQPISEYE